MQLTVYDKRAFDLHQEIKFVLHFQIDKYKNKLVYKMSFARQW